MSCTVVTAYYSIKSKFSKEKYLEWGKTFMKLEAPIVIFTEEHLVSELQILREDRPIKFIIIRFEKLDTWAKYKDKWIENHKIDPEKSNHTPELYAIWAQKAFFVEKAILTNYFNTDYFFWCDFGAFRNPNIDNIILQTFPQTLHFKDDTLLLQSILDLSESEKIIKDDGIYGEKIKISVDLNGVRLFGGLLVGGLWGGTIDACLKWKQEYQIMLEMYFSKGRFAGKDQNVMLSTYLKNPTLASIVKCTLSNIDEWFFFEYLLSNTDTKFELNSSYILNCDNTRPTVSVNIMGGLGNQMFQLATAYAYARKHNGNLKVIRNKRESDGRPLYWNSFLSRFNKYLVDSLPDNLVQWHESGATEYCSIPDLNSNGIFLNGYLQSPKYFNNTLIEQEIKELFASKCSVICNINEKYLQLLNNRDRVIVVHARRTDYCRNQDIINFHGPLTSEYYKEAIKRMCQSVKNPLFLLSSDDSNFWIDLLESIPEFDSGNIYILNNENEINTLTLLRQFNYFIIANSTFSWWAAWLANDVKRVIAPSKWFGPTGPQNYKDIYVPSWELV